KEAVDSHRAGSEQPSRSESDHNDPIDQPSTEEQPSLFADIGVDEDELQPSINRVDQTTSHPTPPSTSPERSENPFLPPHIRDRLTANRKHQTAGLKSIESFEQSSAPSPATAINKQQIIDELV